MDVRDYLQTWERARAASTAKDWAVAAEGWAQVVEANPYNGRAWDGLSEALFEHGEFARALEAFEKVRRFGVYDDERVVTFPGVTSFLMACCHAGLGDMDRAVEALEQAMRERFVFVDLALEHERAAPLRDDPRCLEILGKRNVDGLDRTAGWRTDLDLLRHEARRRRPTPFDNAERFDAEADRLSDDIPRLTDAQIATRVVELLTLLDDGHAFLAAPDDHELAATLPIQPFLFDDGVFVTAAAEEHRDLLGEEIVALDGRPIGEVIEAVDPLIARDNERGPIEVAAGWLRKSPFLHALGLVDDPRKVTLTTRNGTTPLVATNETRPRDQHFPSSESMTQLHHTLDTPLPLYLRDVDAAYWFEHLPEHRLVYFQFNRVADDENEPLGDFVERLGEFLHSNEVERIVVDLRWNGGGNTFLVAPLLNCIAGHRPFDHPGGIFMIIGRRTFSAAGNTAKYLEWLGGDSLTVVGEPPSASLQFIGENVPFTLPYSKLSCNISNLYWQGVTPLDGRSWIAPHLYAPPTFAAYRENRDPAMEAILASLETN